MTLIAAHPATTALRWRVPARLVWAFAVAAAVTLMLMALGPRLLNDADTYWQIAAGDWIIANRAVPHADTFSWTLSGAPWISSQWLAQVVFAGMFDAFGWGGVVAVSALAIASAFGLLTYVLMQRLAATPAVIMVMGAFVLAVPHMLARPHALALPVMVAFVAGLVRAADDRRAPSLSLLPLMTLWANLHGGFTFGLLLIAPVALEALWNAPAQERARVFMRWALFGVGALLAACITPYGPESILVTQRILGLGPALALIGEWQPENFARFGGFELCLLAAIGFLLYRRVTLPSIRILVVLGLLHMALSQSRNGELLGLLAPLFVAAPFAAQLGRATVEATRSILAPVLCVALMIAATLLLPQAVNYQPRVQVTPQAAVEAVRASGKTRLLNSYDFGGYLIAQGIKPFIDGRTELYGADFFLRYDRAVWLKDVDALFALLREYKIDVTLLSPGTAANGLLDRLKGWKRLHADEVAVVYVRTDEAAGGLRSLVGGS